MKLETWQGTEKSPGGVQEGGGVDRDMEGPTSVAIEALSQSAETHHVVERVYAFSF